MFKYKIIEKTEEDPSTWKIEKTGGTVVLTLAEIKASLDYMKEKQVEVNAVWKVAEATKQNIKNNHPHIAKMSEIDLVAAYMYRQAIGTATEASAKAAELDDAIKADEQAMVDILEQTGVKLPEVPEGEKNE